MSAGATTRRPREEPLALVVEVGGAVVDRPRTRGNGDDDQDEDIRRTKRTTAIIIGEAAVFVVVVVIVAFVLLLRAVVVVVLVVDDFDSSDVVAVVRRLSSSSFMVCSPIFGFFGSCWIARVLLCRSLPAIIAALPTIPSTVGLEVNTSSTPLFP